MTSSITGSIITLILLHALCTACDKDGPKEGDPDFITVPSDLPQIVVSGVRQTDGGKAYLEVDGRPFAIYGAQIRLDIFRSVDNLSWNEIERYFAKAEELGVNTVQVSYPWAFLEKKENIYSFDEIDKVLEFACKYKLKVELLWFGTNMIGDAYTHLVPTYILSNPRIRLRREGDGDFHSLYGYTYSLRLDDEWLLSRESKAVRILFGHIRKWDDEHGGTHPVITCQIHNEPDALLRWRVRERKIAFRDQGPLSPQDAWKMTLNALDAVGQAVKSSLYQVATRVNVISGDGIRDFPQAPSFRPSEIFNLEGIDILSFDPYMDKVDEIAYEVSQYGSIAGNYPLIAENRGHYANTASLMLVASALGGGYDIYDLATSGYITSHSRPPFDSEGIYFSDLRPKPHLRSVQTLLKGLAIAGEDVALTLTEDFAAFNVIKDYPEKALEQRIQTTGAALCFKTTDAALAFVLDRGSYLIAYSTGDAVLKIENGETDGYPEGELDLLAGKLYRLDFKSDGKLQSSVRKNIGTIYH